MRNPPVPKVKTGPNCDGCPYRTTSFGWVPPIGPRDAEVLFLMERPSTAEMLKGFPAAGGTGRIFSKLLHNFTPFNRKEVLLANAVWCRPVVWEDNHRGGQRPMINDRGTDYVDMSPSPGQVRECAARYTDELLSKFEGPTIVSLGKIALHYMLDRPARITTLRGSIYEPGRTVPCFACSGTGEIQNKDKKCPACGGRGIQKCLNCNRYKHLRTCEVPSSPCPECGGSGRVPRPPKRCKECQGSGRVSADPENPYVCEKLKPHQLLFPTYHPIALVKDAGLWPVVERDFSRLADLRRELKAISNTAYLTNPPQHDTDELMEADLVSIDIETRGGLDPSQGDIRCIGATHKPFFGCSFDPSDERIPQLLSRPQIVGQNFVLYDWWWLHHNNFTIPDTTRVIDTRYLGKLLNPDTPNDLVYLTGELAEPTIRGYWKTKQNYRDKIEDVVCIDVDATLRVFHGAERALRRQDRWDIAEDYLIPLSRVLFKMRVGGMRIDKEKMGTAAERILAQIDEGRQGLPDWGGTRTENQHAEVQRYLYDVLRLPVQKKRKTGQRTSDANALETLRTRLQTGHDSVKTLDSTTTAEALLFIELVEGLRDLSKLESSFLRYRVSPSNFVHPALNLGGDPKNKHGIKSGAATFRLACENPNAQQIPPDIRYIFLADHPDWEVMSVDLKQAEVVAFLWYVEEWDILDRVLRGGMDAHQEVANKILGREAVESERDTFKTTTFAILFGEEDRTTAARLGRSLEEIREARDYYFKMLPGVPGYRTRMIDMAQTKGYVESPFRFRRMLRVRFEVGRAANQACNHPIQNIPPTVIGRAMIKIDRELPPPARLWMQVHDELLVTYPSHMRSEVRDCVVDNIRAPVPELAAAPIGMASGLVFGTDVAVGPTWGQMEKIA